MRGATLPRLLPYSLADRTKDKSIITFPSHGLVPHAEQRRESFMHNAEGVR